MTEHQDRELHDVIVPMVKTPPGFISGYWTRNPQMGRTHTTIVWESEESARDFKAMADGRRQGAARFRAARFGMPNAFLVITNVPADAGRLHSCPGRHGHWQIRQCA